MNMTRPIRLHNRQQKVRRLTKEIRTVCDILEALETCSRTPKVKRRTTMLRFELKRHVEELSCTLVRPIIEHQ